MANATLTIGGIVGVVLAIPIVGSLLPPKSSSAGSWSPLSPQEFDLLQKATDKPVKLTFTLKFTDGVSARAVACPSTVGASRSIPQSSRRRVPISSISPAARPTWTIRRRQHGLRRLQPDLSAPRLLLQLERRAEPVHVPVPRLAIHVRRHARRGTRAARARSAAASRAERRRRGNVDHLSVEHARSASSSRIRHRVCVRC